MADEQKVTITNEQARIIGHEIGQALKVAIHDAVYPYTRTSFPALFTDAIRAGLTEIGRTIRDEMRRQKSNEHG